MKNFLHAIVSIALASVLSLAAAAPPQTINYQGYLTNPGGAPVNATVPMTFRLYNASTSGSMVWSEAQPSVQVSNGNFNVVLGSVTPVAAAFDVPYWLSVQVGADPEMSPRQPLASSPYAFNAMSAASVAAGATIAGSQITGTLTTAQIADAAVTAAKGGTGINTATTPAQSLLRTTGTGTWGTLPAGAEGQVLKIVGGAVAWGNDNTGTGGVTSITAGAGLTGGTITASGTIGLATTQLLPTVACTANQVAKWSGTAWACAADDNAPAGGTTGQVLAGTGGVPAWTNSPSLGGNLLLAASTSGAGNILKGGLPFIHNFGSGNTFLGQSTGNFSLSGIFNTATGQGALNSLTTGANNTATGASALTFNSTGSRNAAFGVNALGNNAGGNDNTASGFQALWNNAAGSRNTAIGVNALVGNTAGSNNVALGYAAGTNRASGSFNIDIGNAGATSESGAIRIGDANHTKAFIAGISGVTPGGSSLPVVIDSSGQLGTGSATGGTVTIVATGAGLTGGPITGSGIINLAPTQLLPTIPCTQNQFATWSGAAWVCASDLTLTNISNSSAGTIFKGPNSFLHNFGTANTFVGESAGNFFLSGVRNTAGGFHALTLATTGNDNTANGNNALSANTAGSHNTAAGSYALSSNTSGNQNTANGAFALYANTSGDRNTANGMNALSSNTGGSDNTAIGMSALQNNSTGFSNTASGKNALNANTTGFSNTASGISALQSNTSGFFNTADGASALMNNTTGGNNTASGGNALAATTSGSNNTASGANALAGNTTASNNTAHGAAAMMSNISGANNTATGQGALQFNTTGNNNTAVGTSALLSATGSSNIGVGASAGSNLTTGQGNIAIGNVGDPADTGTIRIGTQGVQGKTFVAGILGATTGNMSTTAVLIDNNGQLGTISSSRRYKDDIADMDAASSALMSLRPVTFQYKADQNPAGRRLQYGLIAEEVAEVYPGLVAYSGDGQIETVMYQFLPPMLLNELQKQYRTIQAQSARIAILERELSEIKSMLGAR